MPRKPTSPFGFINFSKAGAVEKRMETLSSEKAIQERQVMEKFLSGFNEDYPEQAILKHRQLPENDHDFLLLTREGEIELQVTELVSRMYTSEMTKEEYDRGFWEEATLNEAGEVRLRIDTKKRDAALGLLIEKKLERHYAPSANRRPWLLVFSTSLYETEIVVGGEVQESHALRYSRALLNQRDSVEFEKIWFTNLITRPVLVWPLA